MKMNLEDPRVVVRAISQIHVPSAVEPSLSVLALYNTDSHTEDGVFAYFNRLTERHLPEIKYVECLCQYMTLRRPSGNANSLPSSSFLLSPAISLHL